MNLGKIISRSARYWPEHEALVDSKQRITFAQLERRTNRLASGLFDLGLQPGAHVAILALNRVELAEAEVAFYKTAMVKVPINARLSLDEVIQILNDSYSQAVIVEGRFAAALQARRAEIPRLCWIISLDDETGDIAYPTLLGSGSEAPVHSDPADDALAVLLRAGASRYIDRDGDLASARMAGLVIDSLNTTLASLGELDVLHDGISPSVAWFGAFSHMPLSWALHTPTFASSNRKPAA